MSRLLGLVSEVPDKGNQEFSRWRGVRGEGFSFLSNKDPTNVSFYEKINIGCFSVFDNYLKTKHFRRNCVINRWFLIYHQILTFGNLYYRKW